MKKILAILLFGAMATGFISCKAREKCPAYGYKKSIPAVKTVAG